MRFPRAGRVSLATAGSLAVALVAAACSGSSAGTSSATTATHLEQTNIVVGALPVVDTAGLYLAQSEGYFKQAGLNVTIAPIAATPLAMPLMAQGKIDVLAGANYVSLLQAQSAGKGSFKILADGTACSPDTFQILTAVGSHITSAAGLAGKRIAVNVKPNIQTLLTNTTLQTAGVNPATVHYVVVPFAKMAQAMAEGKVDAISEVEPFITAAETSNGDEPVMSICSGPTADFPMSGYFSTAKWAQAYPNTARAFQTALNRGQALADANRSAVEQILPTYITTLSGRQAAVVNIEQFPTSVNETHLARVASLMINGGLIGPQFSIAPMLFH